VFNPGQRRRGIIGNGMISNNNNGGGCSHNSVGGWGGCRVSGRHQVPARKGTCHFREIRTRLVLQNIGKEKNLTKKKDVDDREGHAGPSG